MTGLSDFGGFAGPRVMGTARKRTEKANQIAAAARLGDRADARLPILRRVRSNDRTAVQDCIDTYGAFVWALVRKFAKSTAEAEALTEEIFRDVWQVSDRDFRTDASERQVIAMIALRRLIPMARTGSARTTVLA